MEGTPSSAQMAAGAREQQHAAIEDSPATKRVRHAYRMDLREAKELQDCQLLTAEEAADDRTGARERYHDGLNSRVRARFEVDALAASQEVPKEGNERTKGKVSGGSTNENVRHSTRKSKPSVTKRRSNSRSVKKARTLTEIRELFETHIDGSSSVCWYRQCVEDDATYDGWDEGLGKNWVAMSETFANVIPAEKLLADEDLIVWSMNDGHAVCTVCVEGGNKRHEKIDIEVRRVVHDVILVATE